jgi:hypothetical protein
MRARTAVARQSLEQRGEVPVLTEGGEDDGMTVEVGAPVLGRAVVGYVGALSHETSDIKHISLGSCTEPGNG